MQRFWVYIDNRVQGPVEIPALRKLSGFNLLTQVCSEGQESWRLADEVIEIKAYFSSPPRGSSLIMDSQPELSLLEKNQMEMPAGLSMPAAVIETLPPMPVARQTEGNVVETLDESPVTVAGNTLVQPSPAAGALRLPCATCGYKNPRDVVVCMKFGTSLKATASSPEDKPPISLSALADLPAPAAKNAVPMRTQEAISSPTGAEYPKTESPMVEIPVARIVVVLSSVVLAGAVFFAVRHMWKAKHRTAALHPVVVKAVPTQSPSVPSKGTTKPKRSQRSRSMYQYKDLQAGKLPGVAPTTRPRRIVTSAPQETPPEPKASSEASEPSARPEEKTNTSPRTASYSVVNQAYPLQHRTSSPVDSKYAAKRRGDRGLWSGKEDEAIQLIQNHRIYGGQRTIRRNTEILMQVLRDREYSTAFETGKRLYLFNDVDWAASPKEPPVFEVRLTFSGGKEADGSPRTPLRFAFNVDLERQTVEPGGSSMIRSNTLHAFFDESRIPPGERRSVAKDTEELVAAAQPNASPLALDTISKHYAATYSLPALQRVADAYGLAIVNKKLMHTTVSVSEVLPGGKPTGKTETAAIPQKKDKPAPSTSGSIKYTMERGNGKERLVTAQAPSRATPAKLWETMTSYDRLTQFVPDLLVSQREGQDGAAIIVHTVSLSRLMFFVFKVNLHLRILEYPKQHRLEFERIAGDFEKFSGYVEMTPDPTGTYSMLNLHVTLAPKGYLPNWALRGMAQHFLVPVMDAIRSKAESY